MIITAKRIQSEGFAVIPHFPARIIKNKVILEDWIKAYQEEANIDQALILAGGVDKPHGIFENSMQLVETELFNKYNFKNELRAFGDVLRDQIFFLKRSGFNSYLIRKDRDAKDAIKGLDDFSDPYQGASDILEPVWKRNKR